MEVNNKLIKNNRSESLRLNYNEVKERVRIFSEGFEDTGFKLPENYCQMTDEEYDKIRDFTLSKSKELAKTYPDSSLNPNLDGEQGLIAHIDWMTKLLERLWQYDKFRSLFPKGTNFAFLKFLALVHDYSRFIFNGPFPLTYVDWVGDALVERRFFPGIPFDRYLHSIRYITGEKEPPDPQENPLPYIFKALDSLGKPGRDPEKFLNEDYDQWLKRQVELGRFPIKVRRHGKIVKVTALEYKERDIGMIREGLRVIEDIVGGEIGRIFG